MITLASFHQLHRGKKKKKKKKIIKNINKRITPPLKYAPHTDRCYDWSDYSGGVMTLGKCGKK